MTLKLKTVKINRDNVSRYWLGIVAMIGVVILGGFLYYFNQRLLKTENENRTKASEEVETGWRSVLYPKDWQPSKRDALGRFLPDFSYAGYHMGNRGLPGLPADDELPRPIIDVTQAPYNADNTGQNNAVTAIQQAIVDAGLRGGGTVYLPAGTYRLNRKPVNCNKGVYGKFNLCKQQGGLVVPFDNVVIKGDGKGKTRLYFSDTFSIGSGILFSPLTEQQISFWRKPVSRQWLIAQDYEQPVKRLELDSLGDLKVGDWVVIAADATPKFRQEHESDNRWAKIPGQLYYRQITAINAATKSISIDIPTRYKLLRRDKARVYRVAPHLSEVGIQDLSIGMKQSTKPVSSGWGEQSLDFRHAGTAGKAVNRSYALRFVHTVNGWAKNIDTYQPEENTYYVPDRFELWYPKFPHLASGGLDIEQSRNLTIYRTSFGYPSYRGGGGNGYMYQVVGNDNLLFQVEAINGRHNYTLSQMYSSGNVILDSKSVQLDDADHDPGLRSDFHGRLPIANLIDNLLLVNDSWYAAPMPGSTDKGQNSTQSVFWRVKATAPSQFFLKRDKKDYAIESAQYGWGYVIGTWGPTSKVLTQPVTIKDKLGTLHTAPEDFVEGMGRGESLSPKSLYIDQLSKRLKRKISVQLNIDATANSSSTSRSSQSLLPTSTPMPPTPTPIKPTSTPRPQPTETPFPSPPPGAITSIKSWNRPSPNNPNPIQVGDVFEWRVTPGNSSHKYPPVVDRATGIVLISTVSKGVEIVGTSGYEPKPWRDTKLTYECKTLGQKIICHLPPLNPGQNAYSLVIKARANSQGSYINTVCMTADQQPTPVCNASVVKVL